MNVLPFWPISDAGFKIAADFYNRNENGVFLTKVLQEGIQREALTWDVERGAPNEILPDPWQCDNCIGDWHYNTHVYEDGSYKSALTIAKLLVDIVSKNGNMLLNVPLRGDGTFDEKEEAILREFGAWMNINKESIVGTRPWTVFGEGSISTASIAMINSQGFNEGAYARADYQEIRFTQNDKYMFATALGWPADHKLTIKTLSKGNPNGLKRIKRVELLGYGEVPFKQTVEGLSVELPDAINGIIPVLRIRK